MNLKDNWKYFSLTFILTLVFGYFLGIVVSSIIDFRLKDAKFRMPRPKNNIIIEVVKKPKKIKVTDNSKEIEKKLNYNYGKAKKIKHKKIRNESIEDKKLSIDNKDKSGGDKKSLFEEKNIESVNSLESFSNPPNNVVNKKKKSKRKKRKKKNKTHRESFQNYPSNPVLKQRAKIYNIDEHDKEMMAYAKTYEQYRKNEKKNLPKNLVAYNHEDIESTYHDIDVDLNCNQKIKREKNPGKCNFEPNNKFKLEKVRKDDKKTKDWDLLPTREKLCPDFKCQRKYMTCTSNHYPKNSK